MINTYNESSLHKTLKEMFSLTEGSKTEVSLDGHIYDIFTKDETVIEIQTKNISKLYSKLSDAISRNRKVIVVYPLVTKKTIILRNRNGEIISKRKSPKNNSIYDLFNELTGIYPLLLEKKFNLKVLLISSTEERIQTDIPVQSENKKRRFKKNWIKSDKKLNEIFLEMNFNTAKDYLSLLPSDLPEIFTSKDIKESLKKEKSLPASCKNQVNIMIWVLSKMNLIKQTGTQNRFRTYIINKDYKAPELYGIYKSINVK